MTYRNMNTLQSRVTAVISVVVIVKFVYDAWGLWVEHRAHRFLEEAVDEDDSELRAFLREEVLFNSPKEF